MKRENADLKTTKKQCKEKKADLEDKRRVDEDDLLNVLLVRSGELSVRFQEPEGRYLHASRETIFCLIGRQGKNKKKNTIKYFNSG